LSDNLGQPTTHSGGRRIKAMSQSNKSIAQRWTEEIWNRHNASAVGELVAQDFVFHGFMEDVHGHEAIKKRGTFIAVGFPDGRFVNQETLADGDKVVQRWTFQGTHTGEFFGVPGTGKKVNFGGITILRIAGGKVAEHWGYFDLPGVLAQVGKPVV
jgi:steroid delta-isomerase-like uncharacterized protein